MAGLREVIETKGLFCTLYSDRKYFLVTPKIGEPVWQIEKSRFRSTLAGCTITIHEHLDGRVSLRYGPHVVGHFDRQPRPLKNMRRQERGGKGGGMETGENQEQVSSASHTPW